MDTSDNHSAGKCIFILCCTLLLSAILVLTALLIWGVIELPSQPAQAINPSAKGLKIVMGQGETTENGIRIDSPATNGQAVVVARQAGFSAKQYPLLSFRLTGTLPSKLTLFWRSEYTGDTFKIISLPLSLNRSSVVILSKHPEWKGKIIEFGFGIQMDSSSLPVTISDIRLTPPTLPLLGNLLISDWAGFEKWQAYSINFQYNSRPKPLLSPTLVAGSWMLIALMLHWLWTRTSRTRPNCRGIPVALIIVPWLLLHMRWQLNLWHQLGQTQAQFAGKTIEQKHLSAEDSPIFRYAEHLKKNLLPQTPVRIFLLRNNPRDYLRLKLQYYLLPHNIYNYGNHPIKDYLQQDDYLLTVGKIPDLHYDATWGRLYWPKGESIPAIPVDTSSMGTLYRLTTSGEKAQ